MAYSRPKSFGYTQTPAAGGAPPAPGNEYAPWIDVDLTVTAGVPDGFHLMQDPAPAAGDWIFSNPAADTLRVYHNSRSTPLWQVATQTGPILMVPAQIIPRTFPNPAGVTGNEWRSEDCTLLVQMKIGTAGFQNDKTGGTGEGLGIGPIIVWMGTDEGTGATLIANNPIPPYNSTTYGGSSYVHNRMSKRNADYNDDWHNTVGLYYSGGAAWDMWPVITTPAGSAGTANTLQLSTANLYWDASCNKQGGVASSLFDSRVDTGSHVYNSGSQDRFLSQFDTNIKSERKYCYIGIAIQNWVAGVPSDGTYLDITGFRYCVQPMQNRST